MNSVKAADLAAAMETAWQSVRRFSSAESSWIVIPGGLCLRASDRKVSTNFGQSWHEPRPSEQHQIEAFQRALAVAAKAIR